MIAAKILAIYLLAVGVGMFNGSLNIKKLLSSMEKSQGLLVVTGFMCITLGMIVVENHNFWVKDWTVIVTIAGWATLLKGILLIASPETIFSVGKNAYKQNSNLISLFAIALGAVLAYYSFMA